MSYPGDHDAEDVLAGFWEQYAHFVTDDVEWPGLAAPLPGGDPDVCAAEVADALVTEGPTVRSPWHGELRTALVFGRRSADIPAVVGWDGPANHDGDMGRMCAVLRSWEDRFGIRVIGLGRELLLSVAAPPTTPEQARAVAVEHLAFCPDNLLQPGPGDLDAYAEELLGARAWAFWWD
jgi:hypothetical protein